MHQRLPEDQKKDILSSKLIHLMGSDLSSEQQENVQITCISNKQILPFTNTD